ncbi:unnamed protein product [Cercopithifilaria johnstoni]|uniref:Uncharacterized protein n=1 Tax=Cercopithifilaria johnstoni TaxID=2874296 RepID=A0A8J2LVU2_9BILA|nr:unnamed protein product [Cercopithifilaria johnstoni]
MKRRVEVIKIGFSYRTDLNRVVCQTTTNESNLPRSSNSDENVEDSLSSAVTVGVEGGVTDEEERGEGEKVEAGEWDNGEEDSCITNQDLTNFL